MHRIVHLELHAFAKTQHGQVALARIAFEVP